MPVTASDPHNKSNTNASKAATHTAGRKGERRSTSGSTGVYAKLPLENELSKLKVPILLLYGDNDWLYYPTAEDSVRKWKDGGVPAAALGIISTAGHHLYLDNSVDFNRTLISWCERSGQQLA